MANNLLDLLPGKIWKDKNATFLDPCCKSGVFLREIVKRLNEGLKKEIPDLQKRINHILTNQVFGLAITEMTGLLSRRSVYCAKKADHTQYSLCTEFKDEQGNIRYTPTKHNWVGGRCEYCGASESEYKRDDGLESHAYQFIHTKKPEELFNMKFDVIIGNPPYQLGDGGAQASAIPLYHKFIQQAQKLNPRYLTMIVPARWYAGGRGLDKFRSEMLHDNRVRKIVDYFDSTECFPGVDISGGVCYFLWDRDNKGECEIKSVRAGQESVMTRPLLEDNSDTFIRFNEAISIVKKAHKLKEKSFAEIVSSQKPFGLRTYVQGKKTKDKNSVKLYANRNICKEESFITKEEVVENQQWIDSWKLYISRAYGERGSFPYLVLGKPFVGEPNSCCTETFLLIGPFKTKTMAENALKYITTEFFRFLVLQIKNTQDAPKRVYNFVPMQDFSEEWTDEKLYKKYDLTKDEIAFIDSMIRPMDANAKGADNE
jgi:site-specific DNA-methyltransferase (adenine-specific)